MKEQKIVIEIGADGKLTAEAEGFSGDTCIKEMEKLLEGMASEIENVQRHGDPRTAQTSTQRTQNLGRKP